jgi:hypothetical protein
VPLTKELRLFEQLEGRSAELPLIHELRLGHAAEARHAQLALRVVRHESLAEQHDRCARELAFLARAEPIESFGERARGWAREASCPLDDLEDTEHLVAVDILERQLVGGLILQAAATQSSFPISIAGCSASAASSP